MERQSRLSRCILGKAVNQPALAEDTLSSASKVASVRESWFFPRKTDFLSGRLVHLVVLPQIFKSYM